MLAHAGRTGTIPPGDWGPLVEESTQFGRMMMNRARQVHSKVDAILQGQPDDLVRRTAFFHLYGVSAFCALLAVRRGLNAEICATAGILHDLSYYQTGDPSNHAQRSASRAEQLLAALGLFSPDEVDAISEAISAHSAKGQINGPVAEVPKDADVLMHYLFNPGLDVWDKVTRLKSVLTELGAEI
jgi:uncharacterized protein